MVSQTFSTLAKGFISGAVVTASISYAILQDQKLSVKPSTQKATGRLFVCYLALKVVFLAFILKMNLLVAGLELTTGS